ncbi:MAG: DegT/DnrJ/EryC1/StrS family aminotransferase [Planctomycetota bacterium]|jgi:dTDP-4-amino-4,6-dideoxygalactose transaminase
MAIPLVDLKRNYQRYESDYQRCLLEVASSCQFIMGDAMTAFEENFAAYLGVKHVLGVGSGTDALTLLLQAHGAKGKTVLTQNNTFIATTLAITNAGAKIALCDTDEDTYKMDVESYTGPTPDIVMPVHLYGLPYDVEAIRAKFGADIPIFEDACQAHGASLNGKRCGSFANGSAFSFYPGKNLGAFGDGGAVATDDEGLADEIQALRNWGGKIKYVHDRPGGNSRLDTVQAAVLDFKLKHLDEWNENRNRIARIYDEKLAGCGELALPVAAPEGSFQNYHLYVVRCQTLSRDAVLEALKEREIFGGVHYPVPIHQQLVYQDEPFAQEDYPVSTRVAKQIFSLPVFPEMTDEEAETVSSALLETVERLKS